MSGPAKTVLQHLAELDGHLVYIDAVLAILILRCECLEARLTELTKKEDRAVIPIPTLAVRR
jgi:hypothetical protein